MERGSERSRCVVGGLFEDGTANDVLKLHVLIGDPSSSWTAVLAREFVERGWEVSSANKWSHFNALVDRSVPSLIVVELRFGPTWRSVLDALPTLKRHGKTRIVIVTSHGSVATAVAAIRAGADGFLAKPADADRIVAAMQRESLPVESASRSGETLDRAIWEHINLVLVQAGTIKEAARQLGVDRRSLRRMLSKYTP
jgi:two-component system, response regulator RegA